MSVGRWLAPATAAMLAMAGVRDGSRVLDVTDDGSLAVESGAFDAAVSRLGAALFADPGRTLAGMHRALRPGGGACTLVFSRPERNPCLAIAMATARRHVCGPRPGDDPACGWMDLGRPGVVDRAFAAAGFRDVASIAIAAPLRLPSCASYLELLREAPGPLRGLVDGLDPSAAAAAWADIASQLAVFSTPAGWEGPHELLLTAARRKD